MVFGRKKRRITRLLLVEDEPLIAFDNEHLLSDDYQVVATVDSVADAMRHIAGGETIDLVLVDIDLVDGSGFDVARAARAAGIQVLFVTGNCPAGAAEVAAGCLAKPYGPRALLGAIAAIDGTLDGHPPRRLPAGFSLFLDAAATGDARGSTTR